MGEIMVRCGPTLCTVFNHAGKRGVSGLDISRALKQSHPEVTSEFTIDVLHFFESRIPFWLEKSHDSGSLATSRYRLKQGYMPELWVGEWWHMANMKGGA